jgi:hypothetical protein
VSPGPGGSSPVDGSAVSDTAAPSLPRCKEAGRSTILSAGARRWLWRVPGPEVRSRSAPARARAAAQRGTVVAPNPCHATELDEPNGSADAPQSLTGRGFAERDGTGRNEPARIRLPLALP